jgi:GDPmannose 4,6-dehydratase
MKGIAKRALIFGVTGQDGALLARHLLMQGRELHGTSRGRDGVTGNLRTLGIEDRVHVHTVEPTDRTQVADLLGALRPFEIYNLSGQSSVGQSFREPRETFDSHVGSTLAILEATRTRLLDCRFFHASSGEVFGETSDTPAGETTMMAPLTPYGVAKAASTMLVRNYRDAFGLFVCSAFLFNHESLLRPAGFVAQRIARGAAEIKLKRAGKLRLGNLKIVRDWGWAPDYVHCMARMLQQDEPHDYVVATGIPTSLESFVARVFSRLGLDWKEFVHSDETLVRPTDIRVSVGDPRAAAQRLGWTASVRMPEVADWLADAALERAQRG